MITKKFTESPFDTAEVLVTLFPSQAYFYIGGDLMGGHPVYL